MFTLRQNSVLLYCTTTIISLTIITATMAGWNTNNHNHNSSSKMNNATSISSASSRGRRSRPSHFSDKNLSVLESLVLECQLEDVKNSASSSGQTTPTQDNSSGNKVFLEMPENEVDAIQELPGNDACADCGAENDTEWASVSFGILLCASCSGHHRYVTTTV